MIRQIQITLTWLIASRFSIFKYQRGARRIYIYKSKGTTILLRRKHWSHPTWEFYSVTLGLSLVRTCLERKLKAKGCMQSDGSPSNIMKSTCKACNCIASVSPSSLECWHWIIFQIDEIVIFIYFVNRPSVWFSLGFSFHFL